MELLANSTHQSSPQVCDSQGQFNLILWLEVTEAC